MIWVLDWEIFSFSLITIKSSITIKFWVVFLVLLLLSFWFQILFQRAKLFLFFLSQGFWIFWRSYLRRSQFCKFREYIFFNFQYFCLQFFKLTFFGIFPSCDVCFSFDSDFFIPCSFDVNFFFKICNFSTFFFSQRIWIFCYLFFQFSQNQRLREEIFFNFIFIIIFIINHNEIFDFWNNNSICFFLLSFLNWILVQEFPSFHLLLLPMHFLIVFRDRLSK